MLGGGLALSIRYFISCKCLTKTFTKNCSSSWSLAWNKRLYKKHKKITTTKKKNTTKDTQKHGMKKNLVLNPNTKKQRFKHSPFCYHLPTSQPTRWWTHLGSAFGTPQVHTKTITSEGRRRFRRALSTGWIPKLVAVWRIFCSWLVWGEMKKMRMVMRRWIDGDSQNNENGDFDLNFEFLIKSDFLSWQQGC